MATYTVTCEWCGSVTEKKKHGGSRSRFCNKSCSAKWRMSRPEYVASLVTEKFRETARQNMLKLRERIDVQVKLAKHLAGPRNPFRDPKVQRKAQIALRERGFSMLSGGNGKPLPIPQQLLAQRLGWPTEYPVATKMPRSSGYPTCYKLDLAEPTLKIGIEIDGNSHLSPSSRRRDAKKAEFLILRGWTILRFTNREVLSDLNGIVAEIMEVVSSLT